MVFVRVMHHEVFGQKKGTIVLLNDVGEKTKVCSVTEKGVFYYGIIPVKFQNRESVKA